MNSRPDLDLTLRLSAGGDTALSQAVSCASPGSTIVLTTTDAAPLTKFISGFSSPQGLFYAKLSAASTMAIAPILIMGWFSQKQLVRGLTFGAVK